jgi:hypothetical protein|tara:strand:+ start:1636 stop:2667 length:1032 start_codon:yes stop_codon:yes gene_type:complete
MAGYYDDFGDWVDDYSDYDDPTDGDYIDDPINPPDNEVGYDDPTVYDDDYSWMYDGNDDFSTGSIYNDDGTLNAEASAIFGDADPSLWSSMAGVISKVGKVAFNGLKNTFTKTVDGKPETDWGALAAAAGGLYGLYQSQNQQEQPKTGYQGGIPKYEAVREQVANTYDPDRRPGSSAQKYFTDTTYVAPEGAEAARTTAKEEAAGLEALNKANPARQTRAVLQMGAERNAAEEAEIKPASSVIENVPVPKYASGGIANMAKGRYLSGTTDGMGDKIPARIGEKQEAKLSHGEFVIPADVVGHLGNGNSEAGAERLYAMMDKIRKARTGTAKQGKQINPNKFLA